MHTSNQILFGFGLGLWTGAIAHFVFRDPIIRMMEAIFHQGISDNNGAGAEPNTSSIQPHGLREQAKVALRDGEYENVGRRTLINVILVKLMIVISCIAAYLYYKD